ncbi:MAG: glycosyltransferase family 1 protein [Dehalococcoidia bacterium]|nr:glycosyltransferase family 1 protein [Dehalococcoidia bacterium]
MERIAFISVHGCPTAKLGSKDTGGMSVYIRQVAREMAERGVYVDIYTRYHDPNDPQVVSLGERARVIHIPGGPYDDMKESLPRHLPEFVCSLLAYTVREGLSYDLIHSHYWLSGRVGTLLARHWGIPHVTTFHTLAEIKRHARAGEQEPEARVVGERKVIASVDRIVASSQHEKEAMVRLYNARGHKIEVIPCGVDVELFRPMNQRLARRSLGVRDPKVVLFVGRIEPLKGVDILIRAMAQLEQRDSVRALIVGGEPGGDPEIRRLEAMASELGISSQVSFLGRVEQEQLPTYYNAADVCVVPSYYESFGLVALEAMACGTPVIASRVGGLPTVVKGGVTGYLIPWRCPEPFADGLDVLLKSPAIRRAMGRASRRLALGMRWSDTAEQMLALYQLLLAPPLASAAAG